MEPPVAEPGQVHTDADDPKPTGLRKFSLIVDESLQRFFERLARAIGERPWTAVGVALAFTCVCSLGFLRFEFELSQERLYTPQDAQSFTDRTIVESLFENQKYELRVMVVAPPGEPNILTKESVATMFDLYDALQGTVSSFEGVDRGWRDPRVCKRPVNRDNVPCEIYSVLDYWGYDRARFEAEVASDADVVAAVNRAGSDSFGRPLGDPEGEIMGAVVRVGGAVVSAEAFQMKAWLQFNAYDKGGERDDHITVQWMLDADVAIREVGSRARADVHVNSVPIFERESAAAIQKDSRLFVIGYVLIFAYGHVVLGKPGAVHSRAVMTWACFLSVGLSIVVSFSLGSALGFKFNLVTQTLTFLLLGLGMDDAFVIIGMLDLTDPSKPSQERVVEALTRAGPSITVTSLTDFFAFCIGTYTSLPALQWFCVYAAIGILADFAFQCTVFIAFLFIDAKRQEDGKRDMLTCAPCKPADPDAMCFGGGKFDRNRKPPLRRFIGGVYADAILSVPGKVGVLLIAAVLFGMGCYGCTKVYMDFNYSRWFIAKGSYLQKTLDVQEKYFEGYIVPFAVYTLNPSEVDYFDHQDELAGVAVALRADDYVSKVPTPISWYESYSSWLAGGVYAGELVEGRAPNSTAFHQWLGEFLDGRGMFFEDHIKFTSEARTSIKATRFFAYTTEFKSGEGAVSILDSVRSLAEEVAPTLGAFSYSWPFLFWEGFKVITWETLRNVIAAGCAVFLVCLVLLANLNTASTVMLMIALVDIELLGYMHYVDLTFNTVTCINLVLAIGLAVDYSAHVAHAFMVAHGTRNERAKEALEELGASVLNGAFTTFLAVAMLGLAQQYIFRTFFKMFFAIVVLGVFNGLALLPVLLSMWGADSYATSLKAPSGAVSRKGAALPSA